MTNEEKQLLFKDLGARSLYRPFVQLNPGAYGKPEICRLTGVDWPDEIYLNIDSDYYNITKIKPYLRSMSSMTEKEQEAYCDLQAKFLYSSQYPVTGAYELFDFLYEHHLDFRGLIPMGLALEAPEDMYKTE